MSEGQPVIRMRSATVLAGVRRYEAEFHRSRAALARLEALLRAAATDIESMLVLRAPDVLPAPVVERERQLMWSEWVAYRDRIAGL